MDLQNEVKKVKEIIAKINYNILQIEKQQEIKRFLSEIDNFSEDFCNNVSEKTLKKAIIYFYKRIGFEKILKENPYVLKRFNVFKNLEYPVYDNKIASLLKSLITESDLPEDIQQLNKQYINELTECVVSAYVQQLDSIIIENDLTFYGFGEDIKDYIQEREIRQSKMIWLYNMYTKMDYVYAENIYEIYEYSWSDEIAEVLKQEILIDQAKSKEISLENAEKSLASSVLTSFNTISGIILTNFRKQYYNLDVLYNKLTNNGADLSNIFNEKVEGEQNIRNALLKCQKQEFRIVRPYR